MACAYWYRMSWFVTPSTGRETSTFLDSLHHLRDQHPVRTLRTRTSWPRLERDLSLYGCGSALLLQLSPSPRPSSLTTCTGSASSTACSLFSGTVLMLLHVLVEGRSGNSLAASLLWPLLTFGVFIVLENKGIRVGGRSVEPVGFLILLGALASIAVRRALATERKLIDVEQELSTARRIQDSIIPQSPPSVKGIRVAARYQPMTSMAGDFYDFLTSSNGVLTILVADVSGHGVPAALVACMLKVCFAAQKNNAPTRPLFCPD